MTYDIRPLLGQCNALFRYRILLRTQEAYAKKADVGGCEVMQESSSSLSIQLVASVRCFLGRPFSCHNYINWALRVMHRGLVPCVNCHPRGSQNHPRDTNTTSWRNIIPLAYKAPLWNITLGDHEETIHSKPQNDSNEMSSCEHTNVNSPSNIQK